MKRSLILLLALPLVGCDQAPRQQLANCIFDAENSHPDASWLLNDERQSYVWLCMSAHGYQMKRDSSTCTGKIPPVPDAVLHAQCYEPRAKLASLLSKLGMTLRR